MAPADQIPEPENSIRLTPLSMRAMAHPIRLRIIGHLRTHGPATATRLAELFDLNSGATSYHLRQLAQHGFIVDDPERGTGRERWWRAAHRSTRFERSEMAGDEAGEAFFRSVAQIYHENTNRAVDQYVTLSTEWQEASNLSDWTLLLTADEARSLSRDLAELMQRHRQHNPEAPTGAPPGAIPVKIQYQVLPSAPDAAISARNTTAGAEGGDPVETGPATGDGDD